MDQSRPVEPQQEEKQGTVRVDTGAVARVKSLETESASSSEDFIGKTIFEHYEILSVIGTGGMSVVYLAKHLLLNQLVAVKMLNRQLARDERAIMRFKQEAQSASRLDSRYIVGVREFGVLPSGQAVMVLDYINGKGLQEIVARGPLPPKRALAICSQVCQALAAAHSQGVIHRDVKPSNVIVLNEGTDNESIKLVDFGIAKILHDEANKIDADKLTQTGEAVGSPPYMSPEQCQGMPLDARSDIYSTGCMLFELLTGKPPFRGGSVYETIHYQVSRLPDSVGKTNPKLSHQENFDAIILKALAKIPSERYQSGEEFLSALQSTIKQLDSSNFPSRMAAVIKVTAARMRAHKKVLGSVLIAAALIGCAAFVGSHVRPPSLPVVTIIPQESQVVSGFSAFEQAFHEGSKQLDLGNYPAAVSQLKEALVHGNGVGEQSDDYRDCMTKLIKALNATKNPEDAIEASKLDEQLGRIKSFGGGIGTIAGNSVEISKLAMTAPQTPEVKTKLAQLLVNQTSLFLLQHRVNDAAESGANAYQTSLSALGAQNPLTVRALNLYFAAYVEKEQSAKTEELLKSLQTASSAIRSSHPELYAEILLRTSRYQYLKAWHVTSPGLPSGKGATRTIVRATDKSAVAELQASVADLNQAAKLLQDKFKGPSPILSEVYTQLGLCQSILRLDNAAKSSFKKALASDLAVRGMGNFHTAKIHYYIADLLMAQADDAGPGPIQTSLLKEANDNVLKAEDIFEKGDSDAENSQLLGETLNMRALINAKQGNFNEAEKLYLASIKIASRWDRECWTALTAYQRLLDLYQTSSLPEDTKTAKTKDLMRMVQGIKSIPSKPPAKPDHDLDKPIADSAS